MRVFIELNNGISFLCTYADLPISLHWLQIERFKQIRIFFLRGSIKFLWSGLKLRVGRVSRNTTIFFRPNSDHWGQFKTLCFNSSCSLPVNLPAQLNICNLNSQRCLNSGWWSCFWLCRGIPDYFADVVVWDHPKSHHLIFSF